MNHNRFVFNILKFCSKINSFFQSIEQLIEILTTFVPISKSNIEAMTYDHHIAHEDEVLILMDAEIYDRTVFYSIFNPYIESIDAFGGTLIFDGSISQSILGDYRPRTTLFILKWSSSKLFFKWWNSSQNFRAKQNFQDCSDLKVTLVRQNKKQTLLKTNDGIKKGV